MLNTLRVGKAEAEMCGECITGWSLALSPLRFGLLVSLCFRHCSCTQKQLFPEIVLWRREAQNRNKCLFWPFFDENAPRIFQKRKICDTFHIDAQQRLMAPVHTPPPRLTQIPSVCVCEHLHNENGFVRIGTLCHRKDGWL